MTYKLLEELEIRIANLEKYQSAPTEEHRFFDNPQAREVREFSDSEAISNDPEIAVNAFNKSDKVNRTLKKTINQAIKSPPTVKDNKSQEASKSFSTLHRFVVETAEDEPTLPNSFKEAPKAEKIKFKREKKEEEKRAIRKAYVKRRNN